MNSRFGDARSHQSQKAPPEHAKCGWRVSRLADVADFRLGKMLDARKNKGFPRPYLANVNVRWGRFDLENLREMRFEEHEVEKYGLRHGDIVMCEGGEPGRCALWKEQLPGMTVQKALHRIRPDACMSNQFLYYNLFYRGREGRFAPLFTGATIKHLPRQQLAKVEVDVPPMATQERITDILSAYDELIENNRRRIALLEQTVRELYREWFVRLRFPGHKNTRFVGGVPDGWEKVSFSNLAEFVNGYAFKPAQLGNAGLPVIKIPELKNGITAKTPRNPGDLIRKKHHIRDGDLLFSWSGTLAVNVWTSGAALLNQHLFVVKPTGRVSRAFLMFALREARASFENQTVGATMKHIRRSALDTVTICLPTDPLLKAFECTLSGIWELIIFLSKQNMHLTEARELLLPRLMSGEVAV